MELADNVEDIADISMTIFLGVVQNHLQWRRHVWMVSKLVMRMSTERIYGPRVIDNRLLAMDTYSFKLRYP